MKNRILDANEIVMGGEPKFTTEIGKFELIKTLNWYAQNRVSKDAQKYAADFFKKKHKITNIEEIVKQKASTFGFVCRIVNNGATLDEQSSKTFNDMVQEVLYEHKNRKQVKIVQKQKPVISVQERLADKISEIIGDLEGLIDDYIENKFKIDQTPLAMMKDRIKAVHAKAIVDHFKKRRNEFNEALTTTDPYLKEAWSNFKKTELKKVIAFIEQIIIDCNTLVGQSVKTRKPRKRKVKTADDLVKKMQFCEKFDEMNLVSAKPKDLIGASQVWVYNVKYKKIGIYHAKDVEGFSVKGSSLLNYDETKSVQKTVRKPEDFVPQIMKGGKVFLRTALTNLKTVETNLNGRFNKDVILLRIIK